MDPTIYTPRLKLTLVTRAERGSPELEWYHEICTDKESMWWSLQGPSKTLEDSEKVAHRNLPIPFTDGQPKKWRITYAVHKIVNPDSLQSIGQQEDQPTEFIGLVSLKSLESAQALPLPPHLSLVPSTVDDASTLDPTYLTLELAYMFLPSSWGHGYAGEALQTMFDACRNSFSAASLSSTTAASFWSPYTRLYVQSLVNSENSRSQRVMQKMGMTKTGVYVWRGESVYLAGRWRSEDTLWVYGMIVV